MDSDRINQEHKHKTVCFTGHRTLSSTEITHIRERVSETIAELIKQVAVFFMSGGALGFDTITAQEVLKVKKHNPHIKLIMVLPCVNQELRWNEADKQTYRFLLENTDEVVYVSEQPYFDGCMEKRNLYLVEHSGICVAYMKHGRSGTSQTVRMARERGLTIINLAGK